MYSTKMKHLILFLVLIAGFSVLEVAPEKVYSQGKANFACTQHPSGIQTPSAKDPSLVDQDAYQSEGATWDYRWEADCSQGCSKNSDCTQNTSNQPAVKSENSAWCFEFTNGNRCMILTTTDKSLGEDKNKSGGKYGQGSAQSTLSTDPKKESQKGNFTGTDTSRVCKDEPAGKTTETVFKDAKVANNLVRFNAILKKIPDLCVPADLGATDNPILANKGSQKGRLLLCSGSAASGGELTWRIIVGNQLLLPDNKPPVRDRLETDFQDQLAKAKEKIGL